MASEFQNSQKNNFDADSDSANAPGSGSNADAKVTLLNNESQSGAGPSSGYSDTPIPSPNLMDADMGNPGAEAGHDASPTTAYPAETQVLFDRFSSWRPFEIVHIVYNVKMRFLNLQSTLPSQQIVGGEYTRVDAYKLGNVDLFMTGQQNA